MRAGDVKLAVQAALGLPVEQRAENIGSVTTGLIERLRGTPNDDEWNEAGIKRTINQSGLEIVKHFEGLYLKAYKDPVGIWTIGYGHTGLQHKDGTVYAGRVITEAKAEELLRYDMDQFERRVESLVKVPLDDNEFSALVSFDFNTGGLHKSTLLKKLNAGDRKGAQGQFGLWVNAGGKKLAGLVRRRNAEAALFGSGNWRQYIP